MLVQDAQREVRTVFVGGFWGQLVSSALWLVSAALGTWKTPHAAIFSLVFSGFFIYPITQLLLRSAGPARISAEGQPIGESCHADRVYPADVHAPTRTCDSLSVELVLSRVIDFGRSTLSSFYFSLWHAHVHPLVRRFGRWRCCHCPLLFWIIQFGRLGWRRDPFHFRLDLARFSPD
jgi:hypothetical protein